MLLLLAKRGRYTINRVRHGEGGGERTRWVRQGGGGLYTAWKGRRCYKIYRGSMRVGVVGVHVVVVVVVVAHTVAVLHVLLHARNDVLPVGVLLERGQHRPERAHTSERADGLHRASPACTHLIFIMRRSRWCSSTTSRIFCTT